MSVQDDFFEFGQSIPLQSGMHATIISIIAVGNSIVYKVDYNDEEKLLFLYKENYLKSINRDILYSNLTKMIADGKPSNDFLWPEDITSNEDSYIAYIIPIKPARFYLMSDLLKGKIRFKNFTPVINAALNTIKGFKTIHEKGYCLLLDNSSLCIDPATGDTLFCYSDNIFQFESPTGYLGKQRWRAPELLTGEKEFPDSESDLFLLSLILFRMLFLYHPLEGRNTASVLLTSREEKRFYGEDPIYILDPTDNRNRPIPGTDHNLRIFVPMYPKYVLDMFAKAFSKDVLHRQTKRVTEDEWMDIFIHAKRDLGNCQFCNNEIFYPENRKTKCYYCGKITEMADLEKT